MATDIGSDVKKVQQESNLLLNADLSDLTVLIGSRKFPVHKVVFRAASPVFSEMIEENISQKTLAITDISPDLFYRLLRFIYSGTLDLTDIGNIFTFLRFSVKYKLINLKDECYQELETRQVTAENFWDFFSYYDECSEATTLKMKINTFNFLEKNYSWVFSHDKFLFISQKTILKIVSRDTSQLPEAELCEALVAWARMQCHLNGFKPTNANQREILGDAFYQLRLGTFKPHELKKNSVAQLLRENEITKIMSESNLLMEPWNCKVRKALFTMPLIGGGTPVFNHKTCYIVFPKDAFVHCMFVALKNKEVTAEIKVQALNGTGKLTRYPAPEIKKNELCYWEIKELYMESFVVYAIEVDCTEMLFHNPGLSKECAVVLQDNEKILSAYEDFISPQYWKKYFADGCKDETFLTAEDKKNSFIYYMEASFY